MTATTAQQGAGAPPLPAGRIVEVPPGSIFQLLAAWLLMTEGAVALVFLPILSFAPDADIPLGDITVFGVLAGACLASGALLYTRWKWSWWVALVVAVGTAGWLVSDKGLTSWTEAYAGAAFAVVEVALLVLGRRAAGRPEAMALASARIPFRLKLVLVWVAIFFVIALFLSQVGLDWTWMREHFSIIAEGIKYTLYLALGAIVLAVILAMLGSLGRLSKNPVAYGVSGFYTSFFRGTPLIVQLFLIFNAVPQIGLGLGSRPLVDILTLTPVQAGVIGLGLNYGAYLTEIFRAGIQAVGHGQGEAADALGMSYAQRMRRVVLPQATRVIIPPTGNEFIALMKDTALVGILGVVLSQADVFRRAFLLGNQDVRRMEGLILAAGMYWALTAVFTLFQSRLERRMSKGYVRAEARTGLGRRRVQFVPSSGTGGGGIPVEPEPDGTLKGATAASPAAPPEGGIAR